MSSSGPRGSATGQITVGGYTLEVGDAAGSRLALATTAADSCALHRALARRRKGGRHTPSEDLGRAVEDASEVTSKIEHATSLFEEFTSGKLDVATLNDEADALLALLGRLSKAKRWQDVLRVARRLSSLLSLVERWIELLRSLRTALHAARELNDPLGEAWALHELGTLRLLAGRHAEADRDLGQAREIRKRCGDNRGLATTNHNLQVLCETLRRLIHRGRVERALHRLARRPALAAILAIALVVVGGAGGAVLTRSHHRAPFHPAAVAFSFVPSAPHAGQSIVFSATARDARDPPARIANYEWSFGDGSGAHGATASHSFARSRIYKVSLTVTNGAGRRNTLVQMIAVTAQRGKRPTSVALLCPSGRATLGEAVTVSGSIAPARAGATVRVVYTGPSGRAATLTSRSDAEGSYTASLTPWEAGSWSVQGTQPERGEHQASASEPCVFSVARTKPAYPQETTTTIDCPSGNATLGQATAVSGSIAPARAGATVKLSYTRPSGETTAETLKSDAEGSYATTFAPREEGSWRVQASQPQSSEYQASESESCAFTVATG